MLNQKRYDLMAQLSRIRDCLRIYDIRDASDYAEALVAEALGGRRERSRVNKGFDVTIPVYGRIEVKCRQLPLDGRLEERVALGASKEAGFEYLAVVIFYPDFQVKGAVLAPYEAVWDLVSSQQYNRISYRQACSLPNAIDITAQVSEAATR
jgi:hypothetical protein